MNIDWKNKPTFEDYPNNEVVWVVDLEMPDFSEFHVHLKQGEGDKENNVEKYLDLDGFFWEVVSPEEDSQHYEVYRDPEVQQETRSTLAQHIASTQADAVIQAANKLCIVGDSVKPASYTEFIEYAEKLRGGI